MGKKIQNLLRDEYYLNVLNNYIFRGLSMLLNIIVVKVNLEYLGANLYGLWVTVASIISWMGSGDFGICNGLRNELAITLAEDNYQKQNNLIRIAFNSIRKIAFVLFCVIIIINEALVKLEILDTALRMPMYITGCFFSINLCLSIVDSIAFSYQKSWIVSLKTCIISMLSIISVYILKWTCVNADLSVFALFNGLCTLIPNLMIVILFEKKGIQIVNFTTLEDDHILRKRILKTGVLFFGIQICGVVLYSTDNLIINYCLNSEMVSKYSIITKIYDTGSSLFSILLVALWSAVTLHITQGDYLWLQKKIREMLFIWCIFSCGVVMVSICLNSIVAVWLGEDAFYYEPGLAMTFCIYCIFTAFSSIFVSILNGIGIIKVQFLLSVVGAAVNIPLSIYFAKILGMGILGIKFATLISILPSELAMPIQVYLYLRKHKRK